jgi:hypothetical protein
MRNFVTVNGAQFQTYTINGGEYVSTDVDLGKVVGALAIAFDTSISLVRRAWLDEACKGILHSAILSPQEFEVLVELLGFSAFVSKSIGNNGWDTTTRVFHYSNLNTGKAVTWVHFVG